MSLYKFLLCFLLMGNIAMLNATHPYLETEAKVGEGVLSILRNYHINTSCNVSHFYRINNLKSNQGLIVNKKYKLPIYVYTYNATSIRSTIGINDRPRAERILAYNDAMTRVQMKAGDFRQTKELWVPYHEIKCPGQGMGTQDLMQLSTSPAPIATAIASSRSTAKTPKLRGRYELFGKANEEVYYQGNELDGCVFYIVSGHGGPDPGAVGKNGKYSLCEDEYAYDISLRLTKNLLSHGATAYMIIRDENDGIRSGEILPCDKDETCWEDQKIPINQSARLTQRTNAITDLYLKNKVQGVKHQRLIVMHVDSDRKNERVDMFFYHKVKNVASQQFAATLQTTIRQKYEEYRKGRGYTGTVSARDLHMLRETLPTTAFIELGNIKNYNDQARLIIEGNRQLIANWLLEGILQDKKNNP